MLVVDDGRDMLYLLRSVLEDEGLDVATAADDGEALEVAERRPPDLAVLDVTLPVLGGQQVADRLHERHGPGFPILAITADGSAAEKARQMKAFAYLHKPFDLNDLIASVRRGLGQAPRLQPGVTPHLEGGWTARNPTAPGSSGDSPSPNSAGTGPTGCPMTVPAKAAARQTKAMGMQKAPRRLPGFRQRRRAKPCVHRRNVRQ